MSTAIIYVTFLYEKEKIWDERQRNYTPTTRKTEDINKHMALNKGEIRSLVKSSKLPYKTNKTEKKQSNNILRKVYFHKIPGFYLTNFVDFSRCRQSTFNSIE